MCDKGFKMVPSIKGKNSVEDGIEFLKSYDIVIHERCQHTIGEFLTYSWKIDPRTDEVLPILVDKNDHCIDALRYSLEEERHAARPLIMPAAVLQKFAARARLDQAMGMPGRNRFARAR
jgi:phage terminase large subunit